MSEPKHLLTALVSNKPGVLNRIASLFRRRGFNIESLAVGHSEDPDSSRLTIVVAGADTMVEQVRKQLAKLIDVIRVVDITAESHLSRELALIKVEATATTRGEIVQIVDIFRANIIDVGTESLTIEVTGDGDKLDSLIELLRGFNIKEISRSGLLAMTRGGIAPVPVDGSGQEAQPSKIRPRSSNYA